MDEYYVETENCCACRACMDVCPANAIHEEGGVAVIDKNNCLCCGACADACPMNLIHER